MQIVLAVLHSTQTLSGKAMQPFSRSIKQVIRSFFAPAAFAMISMVQPSEVPECFKVKI